jgi:hypothetical protein
MKTVIAALALVTLISGPTFARTADRGTVATNVSARSAWDADSGPQVGSHNTNCYNPYIGNWKHGYPRDDDSC